MSNKSLKTILGVAVLAFLFAGAPRQSHAIEFIAPVTKERAKELGMEVRSTPSGPDAVRVELEFETKGELERYVRVTLEVNDGEKSLLSTSLRDENPKAGRVVVSFTADRSQLDKLTLRVVVLDKTATRVGYWLKVKEFVAVEKPK